MRIDATQKPWLWGTATAALLAIVVYFAFALRHPEWPAGGSTLGLWYGIVGTALMLVAGLLVLVRRLPLTWPIGSRPGWLRAHCWLGALSGVFLLCHTGGRLGGVLDQLLAFTLFGVIGTGVLGLALQHYLPRRLAARVPSEVPPGLQEQACRTLLRRGDTILDEVCGIDETADEARRQVRAFYETEVRPFLANKSLFRSSKWSIANPLLATTLFARMQGMAALAEFRAVLEEWNGLCQERRLILEQQRLWFWMHAWLLVHVPMSAALVVLTIAHVIAGLYY